MHYTKRETSLTCLANDQQAEMQSSTVCYKYCTAAAASLFLCWFSVLHMTEFTGITHIAKHKYCAKTVSLWAFQLSIMKSRNPNTVYFCVTSVLSCNQHKLEESAARRHLSSNADCLSEPPQNFLPKFLTLRLFWLLVIHRISVNQS